MTSDHPGQEAPLLSVITVFWNGREEAPAFVESLDACRRELGFAVEVIAVDNASTDGTAEWIASNAPWVRLVRNPTNAGFAAGCNAGLKDARGEVLLLLNPDCEANAGALTALVRLLLRNRGIGMAACRLLNADGTRQFNHYREPGALSYLLTHSVAAPLFTRLRRSMPAEGKRRLVRTDWLMGACLATRRDVVERIGFMEESYFLYAEDTDWCRRARDAGFAVVLAPETAMRHRQGTSARKRAEFAFLQMYRSLVRYGRGHLSPLSRTVLAATILADMVVRLPIYLLQGRRQRLGSALSVMRIVVAQDPDFRVGEGVPSAGRTGPPPPPG